jgi:hypothetical protein
MKKIYIFTVYNTVLWYMYALCSDWRQFLDRSQLLAPGCSWELTHHWRTRVHNQHGSWVNAVYLGANLKPRHTHSDRELCRRWWTDTAQNVSIMRFTQPRKCVKNPTRVKSHENQHTNIARHRTSEKNILPRKSVYRTQKWENLNQRN